MKLELPVTPIRCTEFDCDFPLGGKCAQLLEAPFAECDKLVRLRPARPAAPVPPSTADDADDEHEEDMEVEPDDSTSIPQAIVDDTTAPWTGKHIAWGQLSVLAEHTIPRLVALVGLHDAGKTSLLASFFLQLANGQYGAMPYRFASSRTLLALDQLVVRANRWSGGRNEQIVDHTPTGSGAQFLHIGLRAVSTSRSIAAPRHIDVLFSDISGEEAASWAHDAAGASASTMAFVRHADVVLLVADAARLVASEGRAYDGEVSTLLRRTGQIVRGGPRRPRVFVVFTKIDCLPDGNGAGDAALDETSSLGKLLLRGGAIQTAVRSLRSQGLEVTMVAVSAFPRPVVAGQAFGVTALFDKALAAADRRTYLVSRQGPITAETQGVVAYAIAPKEWS